MSNRLTIWWFFTCLVISCDPTSLEEELNPNGLYAPYLTSTRNSREVTLKWGRPACALCGICPCPQLAPDYFEILYSEMGDLSNLKTYSVVNNDVFETTIKDLNNNQPYYFAIKAVISGEKYTKSKTIMTIPDMAENIDPIFQTIDKDAELGSWSPDQSLVAYLSDYTWNNGNNSVQSIFVSPSSGNISHLIEKNSRSPEWSPDGNKIVYHTDNGEVNTSPGYRPTHIAVYYVLDSTITRLTDGNSFNYLPSWSIDGEWIAYLSDKARGNEYNIWKISSTGGTPIQVTSDFNDLNDLAITGDRSPKTLSWSKDGENIAFARLAGSDQVNTDIYSVPSDGGAKSILVSSPWNDFCPAYSPDGKTIAFISDRSGSNEIWTMDLKTKGLSQITGSTGKWIYENSGKIEWSTTGDKILFTSNSADFFTLYSVDITISGR